MNQRENSGAKLSTREYHQELRQELLQQFYDIALERYGRGSAQARSFAQFLTDSVCPPHQMNASLDEIEVAEVL